MAKKLIDLDNLQKLVTDVLKPKIDSKQPKVISATISTAAATAAKVCTISGYIPAVGDIIMLTFTLGNSISTPTLNINSTGAKNIVLGSTNASTTTLTLGANGVAMVVVGSTTYQLFGSHRTTDVNTTASIFLRNNSERTVSHGDLGYIKNGQYISIYASGSVPNLIKRTNAIDLFSNFVRVFSASISSGSKGTFNLNDYNSDFTNSLNGLTLTAYQPLYLVGSPTSDGKFAIDNTSLTSHFTQTLPTSVDNKIYVELGYATSAGSIAFIPVKRWLTYVNGLGIVDLYKEELSKKAPNNSIPQGSIPYRSRAGSGNADSYVPYKKTYSKTANLQGSGTSMYIDVTELDLRVTVSPAASIICTTISGITKSYDFIAIKNGNDGTAYSYAENLSIGSSSLTVYPPLDSGSKHIVNAYISSNDVNSKVFELIVFLSGTGKQRSRMFIREL